jgi:hypothetical protein
LNMKNSWFRNAIVTALVAALTAFAIPANAAPRDRNNNQDNQRYDSQDNRRNGNDDSYRNQDDSYRGQDDSGNQRDQNYRGRNGDWRNNRNNRGSNDNRWRNDGGQQAYDRAVYNQPAPQPVYQQHRSLGKSVLIVGGSAAAGAGIGALAGGGKGAGIGAIVGGLGGFIFDRATAHH